MNKIVTLAAIESQKKVSPAAIQITFPVLSHGAPGPLVRIGTGNYSDTAGQYRDRHSWLIDEHCALKIIEALHEYLICVRTKANG